MSIGRQQSISSGVHWQPCGAMSRAGRDNYQFICQQRHTRVLCLALRVASLPQQLRYQKEGQQCGKRKQTLLISIFFLIRAELLGHSLLKYVWPSTPQIVGRHTIIFTSVQYIFGTWPKVGFLPLGVKSVRLEDPSSNSPSFYAQLTGLVTHTLSLTDLTGFL